MTLLSDDSYNVRARARWFIDWDYPQPFQKGDVCLCAHGFVGMITAETPDKDGVWKGVHLHPDKAGDPWESKKPKRVLNTEPFVRFVKLLETAGV